MIKSNYEKLLVELINSAELIDHSHHPCDSSFLKTFDSFKSDKSAQSSTIANETSSNYLIFIRMANRFDFASWLDLAKCLHIWDLDARGYHNGLWRLTLHGSHLLIVGSPYSSYSIYKPNHVVPFAVHSKHKS